MAVDLAALDVFAERLRTNCACGASTKCAMVRDPLTGWMVLSCFLARMEEDVKRIEAGSSTDWAREDKRTEDAIRAIQEIGERAMMRAPLESRKKPVSVAMARPVVQDRKSIAAGEDIDRRTGMDRRDGERRSPSHAAIINESVTEEIPWSDDEPVF